MSTKAWSSAGNAIKNNKSTMHEKAKDFGLVITLTADPAAK